MSAGNKRTSFGRGAQYGYQKARQDIIGLILDFKKNYPEEIWPPPQPGSSGDCYAAAMARHICKLLPEMINALPMPSGNLEEGKS